MGKRLLPYLIVLFFVAFFFSACEKENTNGNILVSVKYNGINAPYARIYLQQGTLTNPGINLSQYDQAHSADVNGQNYFSNLTPDGYYIFATSYDQSANHSISGEASVTIVSRSRMNEVKVSIDLH